jgi:hypothetical protein
LPVDPYAGIPVPNTLADAVKMRAQLDALFNPVNPVARVVAGPVTTPASAAAYSFTTVQKDNMAPGSPQWSSGAPTRLTCKKAGVYVIRAGLEILTPAVSFTAVLRWNQSGVTTSGQIGQQYCPAENNSGISVTTIKELALNDWVELVLYHGGAGSTNWAELDWAFVSV